jgi:hypothetical protein
VITARSFQSVTEACNEFEISRGDDPRGEEKLANSAARIRTQKSRHSYLCELGSNPLDPFTNYHCIDIEELTCLRIGQWAKFVSWGRK